MQQRRPHISLLTPTYERPTYIRLLARMIACQTYPLDQVEWIVVDDSASATAQWLVDDAAHPLRRRLMHIHYEHVPRRMCIGEKRNHVIRKARGEFCVQLDDDDCYGAGYLAAVMRTFDRHPDTEVVGSSVIHLLYPRTPFLHRSGPFSANHSCGATISFRRRYADRHEYDPTATFAEERSFLDDYSTPVQQMRETYGVFFALVHARNTVDKTKRNISRRPTWIPWPTTAVSNAEAMLFYHMHTGRSALPLELRDPTPIHRVARAICHALVLFCRLLLAQLQWMGERYDAVEQKKAIT